MNEDEMLSAMRTGTEIHRLKINRNERLAAPE